MTTKPKVLVTHSKIPQRALDILQQKCELVICPEIPHPSQEQVLQRVQGVDAIFWFTNGKVDKELLDKAGSNLKVVATMSVGYDHIDVSEVKSRGIKVSNTPDVLTAATADIAVTLLLTAARRVVEGLELMKNGQWQMYMPMWMTGQDLQGSTVGIVGFGRIGQAVAKRLKAFEISRLLYAGHSEKPEGKQLGAELVPFTELLKSSDYVIAVCPLTEETKNLFNDKAFSLMKPTAVFVNISRGGVVDQPALVRALETKKIWAAGLDVVTPEPLPPDDPLLKLNNCVITPHIGSATVKTRTEMAVLTAKNIICGLEGTLMPSPL